MQFQLRDYQVKPGEMTEWVSEWSAHIRPLRERFGFRVVGAWTIANEHRFVWILAHADFETADRSYYDSAERRALEPDPARHLARAVQHFMERV
jgi:hypothetical protein